MKNGVPLVDLSQGKFSNLAGDSFTPGAHWEGLPCDGDVLVEKTLIPFRAPTVPAGEVQQVRKKNYEQKFDRMVFSGKTEIPVRLRSGRLGKASGKIQYKEQAYSNTTVDMDWARKRKLEFSSGELV